MRPANYDLELWQGQTFNFVLVWKDSTGSPINLTGYSGRMQLRPTVMAEVVFTELSTENGKMTFDHPNGRISLTLSAEETAQIKSKNAVYDLEIFNAEGEVRRLMEGKVLIHREVTR